MAQMTQTVMGGCVLHNESEIGPPNAEPHGLWKILRNSLILTVIGGAVAVIVFFA